MLAIGSVYYNMLWCFMEGLLSAQDCLSSHSFGMQDYGILKNMKVSQLDKYIRCC